MMAASVYATPPPDLSGEDTALSDASNSSQITNNSTNSPTQIINSTTTQGTILGATINLTKTNINKTLNLINNNNKRTLSSSLSSSSSSPSSSINNPICNNSQTSSSSQLDNVPDPSKKRRKQSTPIRITATLNTNTTNDESSIINKQIENNDEINISSTSSPKSITPSSPSLLLSKLNDQLNNNNDHIVNSVNSKNKTINDSDDHIIDSIKIENQNNFTNDNNEKSRLSTSPTKDKLSSQFAIENKHKNEASKNSNNDLSDSDDDELEEGEINKCNRTRNTYNKQNNIDHQAYEHVRSSNNNSISLISLKKEENENKSEESLNGGWKGGTIGTSLLAGGGEHNNNNNEKILSNGINLTKPEDWLSGLAGLPFPFPPEAAAALTASGYLPQIPLLAVPSMSHFTSVDGLRANGPPLRIFNPEAYCDLCNKEFCNKYFLKTHKANKHGIYEPPVSSSDMPTPNQLSQLTQMQQVFQLHQNTSASLPTSTTVSITSPQIQISTSQPSAIPVVNSNSLIPQQSRSASPPQTLMPPEPAVFCDICFKRFSNVFAMRRHRLKVHELQTSDVSASLKIDTDSAADSGRLTPFRLPEDFREDFSIEQEDVTFTPQPRKLSPSSSQQAREANFSFDKLKRLGVINPEAFCEMCCKEYCNKYFLRTHKLRRHGILIPIEEMKEDQPTNHRSPWHYVQTSPLNLMMTSELQHNQLLQKSSELLLQQQLQIRRSHSIDEQNENLNEINSVEKPINHECNDDVKMVKCRENNTSPLLEESQMKVERKSPSTQDDLSKSPQQQSQDSDAISVDLQKLQSMILQLNDLNSPRIVGCQICGKEMENQYILHAHMIAEHSNLSLSESINGGIKRSRSSSPTPSTGNIIEVCKHCEKEFTNIFAFKQHLYEIHGIQPQSPIRDGFLTPDRPVPGISMPTTPTQIDRSRPAYTITPTSSYCEICNKELCNKYFMKTHMQRMHGIEIENGAQIGGVVCNICNKELCSKYFLRVHKHNTHGIVDEGSPLPQPRANGDAVELDLKAYAIEQQQQQHQQQQHQQQQQQQQLKSSDADRYYTHYTEVCPICSRRFKNSKWLRSHLMNDHGKIGTDKLRELDLRLGSMVGGNGNGNGGGSSKPSSPTLKIPNGAFNLNSPESSTSTLSNVISNKNALTDIKEYYCSYCQFSTPYLTYLFIHERIHTQQQHLNSQTKSIESIDRDRDLIDRSEGGNSNHSSSNLNQNETPVPLVKEQPIFFQPNSLSSPSSNNDNTPSSTPRTTPTPQILQPDNSLKVESNNHSIRTNSNNNNNNNSSNNNNNILNELANITQRPAIYALPQESGPMIMQSFLIEENIKRDASTDNSNQNTRFVPSFVFLPVKERISTPITVSFTLTPA